MNKIEELLKMFSSSLDENKTKDIKVTLEEAVNEVAEAKAKELFEAEVEVYEKSLDDVIKSSKEVITLDLKEKFDTKLEEQVKVKVEEATAKLEKEAIEKLDEEVTNLKKETIGYITYGVKELVEKAIPTWEKEADLSKANKIMEEFSLFAQAFDVKLSETTNRDEKLEEANIKLDEAVEKVQTLEAEKIQIKQAEVLKEAKIKLSAPQQDKLDTLIEGLEVGTVEDYQKKVDLYVGTIAETKIEEKVIEEKKIEGEFIPSWKR